MVDEGCSLGVGRGDVQTAAAARCHASDLDEAHAAGEGRLDRRTDREHVQVEDAVGGGARTRLAERLLLGDDSPQNGLVELTAQLRGELAAGADHRVVVEVGADEWKVHDGFDSDGAQAIGVTDPRPLEDRRGAVDTGRQDDRVGTDRGTTTGQ